MRRIDAHERRARLARRQHLTAGARAPGPVETATSLVGLHSTDPASVYLSVAARMAPGDPGASPEAIGRALYEDRSLVRVLGMRRTMFVVPAELVPVIHAACARDNAAQQRRATIQMISEAGLASDPERWLAEVEAETLLALEELGEATATELAARVEGLRRRIPFGEGKRWQGELGMSTRVLFGLSAAGRIVRARPRGTWLSTQYRWTRTDAWLGTPLTEIPTPAARDDLVRRWLRAFGPGTERDLRWWTGWTAAEVRRALGEVGAVKVELDDGVGYVLPDDIEPADGTLNAGDRRSPADRPPWVALLPALDPTTMGWAERDWYLGQHRSAVFDTNGNAGPTVWLDGRIVGGWGQRPDGAVATRLLEDVGAEATTAVAAEADRLARWLGPVRIIPRFRTPIELELGGVSGPRRRPR